MTDRSDLPVLQDPADAQLKKREILESLQSQAVGGNAVAVAALDRMEKDARYQSFILRMDEDEDPSVAVSD